MIFPPLLSWIHYLTLMRVDTPQARAFYEIEAEREGWSTRELERQVASLLHECLAKSRDKDHEASTVGIVLCSNKSDAMVKITLPEDNEQIHASRYRLYLPTEDELRVEIEREREEAERALRLAAGEELDGEG